MMTTAANVSLLNNFEIVVIKGFGSGIGSLVIAAVTGQLTFDLLYVIAALALGFVAYGLSIFFYIYAQRYLGAAKTSAYYAFAPFIGTVLSLIIYKEIPSAMFITAFIIMVMGAVVVSKE